MPDDGWAEVGGRVELRDMLDELVARVSMGCDREERGRIAGLGGRLAVPAAASLQPDLERLLVRFVEAGDSFARDHGAHVLAMSCGSAALPTLMRALVHDRNDDGGEAAVGCP